MNLDAVATLACDAAIELDNIYLSRPSGVTAVCKLAATLEGINFRSDFQATLLVQDTLRSIGREDTTEIDALERSLAGVCSLLAAAIAPERHVDSETVTHLRDFCVTLSRTAAAKAPRNWERT